MSVTIIYIPGLGEKYDGFRRHCLAAWRVFGLQTAFVSMNWTDGQNFIEKKQKLKAEIARHTNVVLVGESAGAAMALAMLHESMPQLKSIVTLCGVAQVTTPIAQHLQQRAPALRQARDALAHLPDHTIPIRSLIALYDPVIKPNYSVATNAQIHRVFSVGHLITIMLCLTLFSPYLIRIARKSVL